MPESRAVDAISPGAMDEILDVSPSKEGCGHPADQKLLDGSGRCGPCYYISQRQPKKVEVHYTYDSTLANRPALVVVEMEVPTYAKPEAIHDLVCWHDIQAIQEASFCSWHSEADGLWVIKSRYVSRPQPYQESKP